MKPIFKLLLLLILAQGLFTTTYGASYYFSTNSGNDARSAKEAQNPNTPWKTIGKLNMIFGSLRPGDNIFFKRGEKFYGTINITKSGTSGNPLKFGAYGSGSTPIITSLVTLTNWKSTGNGIFETSNSYLTGQSVNVVLVNNQVQEMGRFPNSDAPEKGYLTYQSHSGHNSITSKDLNSANNWKDGEAVIRKLFWITDRHPISNHSGSTLGIRRISNSNYEPRPGYGFFIQNHIQTLDKFGEWYFNPVTKKFSLHFGTNSPSNVKVEVATRDYLITSFGGARFLIFENLHFKGAVKQLFDLSIGNDVTIKNTTLEFAGENSISIEGITRFTLENSTISYANNSGLELKSSPNATIKNNLIENIYLFPGLGLSGDNKGVGIYAVNDNTVIENNKVTNSGYIAIRFGGNNTIVNNNYINNFCLTKNDGGGIYSFAGRSPKNFGRKVTNNIIINGIGVKEGTPFTGSLSKPQAEGIYLDDNVSGVEVSGNTVAHITSKGIYLHNTDNIEVKNNLIYDSDFLIFLRNDHMGNQLANTKILNNRLLLNDPFQNYIQIASINNDVVKLADFENNTYSAPFQDDIRFQIRYNVGTNQQVNETFNLEGWQNTYGKDKSSRILEKKVDLYEVNKQIGNNRFTNGTFDSNANGITSKNSTISWDNSGKMEGGSIKISANDNAELIFASGPLRMGKFYRVKFTAIGNKNQPISMHLRQTVSPWNRASYFRNIEVTKNRGEFEVIFTPLMNLENSRLAVSIPNSQNFDFWIDNMEIIEVEVKSKSPSDYILFQYNNSGQASNFNLGTQFIDLTNKIVKGNISIPSFSSILLIKDGSSTIEEENPGFLKMTSPIQNAELIEGSEINIQVESNQGNGAVDQIEYFSNGTSIGTTSKAPFNINWVQIHAGIHVLTATAKLINGKTVNSEPISVNVFPKVGGKNGSFSLYINTGSVSSTNISGKNFVGESAENIFFNSSQTTTSRSASDVELFQTERFGKVLKYSIPVPNGTYTIRTLHNELWFGSEGNIQKEGDRVYDIQIEGKKVKENFDLFKENGNQPIALTFTNVEVKDGILNIDLNASNNNASISGIAIDDISKGIPDILIDNSSSKGLASLHFNSGSSKNVFFENKMFLGDLSTDYFSTSKINTNTFVTPENLYQTERFGRTISYTIPINNGQYSIKTYHNELWFGSFGPSGQRGRRVFDIYINGKLVKKDFDIFVESNNKPIDLTFNGISISDNKLTITMVATSENATISGLSIIPEDKQSEIKSPVSEDHVYINAGSANRESYLGIDFDPDANSNFFSSASRIYFNSRVSDDALFRSERFARDLSYNIPVGNGLYTVYTFHNELWFGSFGPKAEPSRRVFNIYLENQLVKRNFDIFLENGNRPLALKFENIQVTDGIMNIDMNATNNNSSISGIAIIPKGSTNTPNLRTQWGEDLSELYHNSPEIEYVEGLKLYPNPASSNTVLEVNSELQISSIVMHATSGQFIKSISTVSSQRINNKYVIPVENIKNGMYILSIFSDQRLVKRLKLIVNR